MALGFFSFAKFLMYRDLDAGVWPDESKPYAHETIAALLDESAGFAADVCTIGEEDQLDISIFRRLRPTTCSTRTAPNASPCLTAAEGSTW